MISPLALANVPVGRFAAALLASRLLSPGFIQWMRFVSMRFVSAHFGAEVGCCRGSCQLKTSRQASQQLLRHFMAVQAFAFRSPQPYAD
jgi:hypothetical protein